MIGCLLALLGVLGAAEGFDDRFTGGTLRVDLLHRGNAFSESFTVSRVVEEVAWSGPRYLGEDPLDLGVARFRLLDARSGALLYSRGYASVFLEWITTAQGKGAPRVFEESVRLPEPRAPAQLVLEVRDPGEWREVFRYAVDPGSEAIDRSGPRAVGRVRAVRRAGDPRQSLDVLLVGDGYRRSEGARFDADCAAAAEWLLGSEPFKGKAGVINVWSLHAPSPRSGISDHGAPSGLRDNPFGTHYNGFGLPRYVITYEDRRLREATAQVPYDTIVILLNEERYGGGGIYNLWSTCAARHELAGYLLVHELGHNLAALADEYYTSRVAYENVNPPDIEPWEPNITALHDPDKLKWGDLASPGLPLPSPWDQEQFDAAAGGDRAAILARLVHRGKGGAFEGGGYRAKGIYRPEVDCIMFSRGAGRFCAVCERHLSRVIGSYSGN